MIVDLTHDMLHALERSIESQQALAKRIEAVNPRDPYAALTVHDDVDQLRALHGVVSATLTRVPTKVDNFLAIVRRWVERDSGNMEEAIAWMYADARSQHLAAWPFVETPGEFTARLNAALIEFSTLLAAVRHVLIEKPPVLVPPQPVRMLTEAEMDELLAMPATNVHSDYANVQRKCAEVWGLTIGEPA